MPVIYLSSRIGRPLSDDGHVSLNPSATTLSIGRVRATDRGLYECIAESVGGRRTARATLYIVTRSRPLSNSFNLFSFSFWNVIIHLAQYAIF